MIYKWGQFLSQFNKVELSLNSFSNMVSESILVKFDEPIHPQIFSPYV